MSRILIADDEPYILRSLDFALYHAGHQVTTARDGREALEALRSKAFDIALLDIIMPHVDGFTVVETLRQELGHLPCAIVFLTAKGMDEDQQRGLALGASAFVTKPYSPIALTRLINDLTQPTSVEAQSS